MNFTDKSLLSSRTIQTQVLFSDNIDDLKVKLREFHSNYCYHIIDHDLSFLGNRYKLTIEYV